MVEKTKVHNNNLWDLKIRRNSNFSVHFGSSFTGIQPRSLVRVLSESAFEVQQPSGVVAAEPIWPTGPRTFALWPFKKSLLTPGLAPQGWK